MRRYLLVAAVAAAALVVGNAAAFALMIAPPQPAQTAINAQVVLTGKVTTLEKDPVEVLAPFPGSKDKQKYKIAVVKIDSALAGIDGTKVKEVKVGIFQPVPPPPGKPVGIRPPRGPAPPIELKVGQELLLCLTKHPSADFYIPNFGGVTDISTPEAKKQLEEVKKVTTILADPMKGLKSDKAEVRAEAAAVMVMKYRSYPQFAAETEQVAVGADESKLVLKALADGEWKNARFGGPPNAFTAFNQLGLTEKDGWIQPIIVNVPGQPAPDYGVVMKDAFTKWLAGPGKDYQIKKVVPKAKAEK